MSLKIRQCQKQDIIDILEDPWPTTLEEMNNFGYLQKYGIEGIADMFLQHTYGHHFVILDGDRPVAAVGAQVIGNNAWASWSIRSSIFPEHYKEVTVIFSKLLSEKPKEARELGMSCDEIILVTSVDSPKVEKWAKIIGFKKVERPAIKELYSCDVAIYVKKC